ncbi:uncharacterized protein F4822DRAFT_429042 [Hypoxylon trugodes]|uniref:uncharacterized protein n=1 Tax=Hypoxylon trugodes TaxID=326681 RepID=UPI002199FB79|nr:uncharacterized protein F4822DRAFT_429042 [Hypoxylon trugodes]KAI1388417.1 hypothetical protein F4822DRAFT_429042 [Hypoxylon trugodes]
MDSNSNTCNIKRALASPPASRSRIPLSNKSNISAALINRRSPDTRWERKDSSEGQPSPHGSIYDAPWVPEINDTTVSPYQTPAPPQIPDTMMAKPSTPPPHPIPLMDIDLNSESPLSRLEAFNTPFLYGHGTELAPIAEQRSIATLRTAVGGSSSISASNVSSPLKIEPSSTSSKNSKCGSTSTSKDTPPRPQLRRQNSFSLDDMFSITPTSSTDKYHTPIIGSGSSNNRRGENSEPATIRSSSSRGSASGSDSGFVGIPRLRNLCKRHSPPTIQTVDIHAYPQKPAYPPHQAPPTPLRFAEWVATHEGSRSHTCAYPAQHHGHRPSSSNPFEQPFRGVRSGHGNLESHPYMRRHSIGSRPASGTIVGTPQEAEMCMLQPVQAPLPRDHGIYRPGHDIHSPVQYAQYQPLQENPAWMCKTCNRPVNQRWSLLSTLIGGGTGSRRGEEWCTRCAWRKIMYTWCCCGHFPG